MLRRFRNKLKTLSDQDFLDRLIHHDVYPCKYFPAMEKEARNRFFTNRHFNGDNDEYVHPDTYQPTLVNRGKIVAGSVMIVVLAALTFVLLFTLRHNDLSSVRTTSTERTGTSVNTPAGPSPDKSTVAITAADAVKADKTPTVSENKDKPNQEIIAEKPAISAKAVPSATPEPTHQKQLQWESSYRPLYVIPEKQVQLVATAEVEDNTPDPIDDHELLAQNEQPETELAIPEKAETEAPAEPKQEITKPEPKPEEKPKTEPAAVAAKEPISDYSNVSQLTVPLLRQFIPFINDWAYQQTQQPGIKDYYVENNSLVNLVLTREYSDSLAAFQQQKAAQLMNRYYAALKTALGEEFPQVRINIKFVKYNTDL
jgi:hypothetical protein